MPVTPNPQSIVNVVEGKVVDGGRKSSGKILEWCSSTWRAVFSEFVSTMLLVSIGCMTNIPLSDLPYQSPVYGPLGFGFIVMFNIQIFGHISGAHMNPAVTLASVVFGQTSIATAVAFTVAQCLGSILGYGLLMYMSSVDNVAEGVCVTLIHPNLTVWQALVIEILLTSALNFINCSVWDPVNKHKADSVPIKFGLAIAGLSLAGGPLTGASMNPARSLGPVVWTGMWNHFWVYCVGPLIAGVLPTLLYKYTWLKKPQESEAEVLVSNGENK